jgi:hypothetical protein
VRPPSQRDIDKVMRALGPLRQWGPPEPHAVFTPLWTDPEQAEAACREYIAAALKEIEAPRPGPGEVKEKMDKLTNLLARARNAAKELPPSLLDADVIADLEQKRLAAERWSDKILVKKTNQKRAEGERMLLAAARARHLIIMWTEHPVLKVAARNLKHAKPTDIYVRITQLMHKIATGKERDAEQACADHLELIWESITVTGEPEEPDWLRRPE